MSIFHSISEPLSFFFARVRARVYRSAMARHPSAKAVLAAFALGCLAPLTLGLAMEKPLVVDHSVEQDTRETMQIRENCRAIKARASAIALMGAPGAAVSPHVRSRNGLVVLEGLREGVDAKVLDTEFLGPYQDYPLSLRPEPVMQPAARYPLAVTLASLAGQKELAFQKGDYLAIQADGQTYVYYLAELKIPAEGVLRLYVGTDDTLYFDRTLKHPAHSGACGGVHGR
jgi:hypothetical protein